MFSPSTMTILLELRGTEGRKLQMSRDVDLYSQGK